MGTALATGYEVVKEQYEAPCEHPACDLVHRHLYNARYWDEARLIEVCNMAGEVVSMRWESRYHEVTRVQWLILLDGVRVGDAHDTKRDALAEASRRPTI